jgi:hypothetical protein
VTLLSIDYPEGGASHLAQIAPGQIDWQEPTERVHHAVNVGKQPWEQITALLLDRPDAAPQL